MIKYQDGELRSMLSPPDKDNPDWIGISAALKWAMGLFIERVAWVQTYTAIDNLPEKILDALAIELRTQYYSQTLPIETKRELVRKTFWWYSKAGTRDAVEELVNTVFGKATVIEWFEDGGEPYTFKIETQTHFSEDSVATLETMIDKVKNARSQLLTVATLLETHTTFWHGIAKAQDSKQTLTNDLIGKEENTNAYYVGFADFAIGRENTLLYQADSLKESKVPLSIELATATDTKQILAETIDLDKTESETDLGAGIAGAYDTVKVLRET